MKSWGAVTVDVRIDDMNSWGAVTVDVRILEASTRGTYKGP